MFSYKNPSSKIFSFTIINNFSKHVKVYIMHLNLQRKVALPPNSGVLKLRIEYVTYAMFLHTNQMCA